MYRVLGWRNDAITSANTTAVPAEGAIAPALAIGAMGSRLRGNDGYWAGGNAFSRDRHPSSY